MKNNFMLKGFPRNGQNSNGYSGKGAYGGIHSRPEQIKNVLGNKLKSCCKSPMTGFFRNGRCDTGPQDAGAHVVCAQMTAEFLAFSKSRGNDLSTPMPQYNFAGLAPGDCWCLCALRWQEAFEAGAAPQVRLASTHEAALEYIKLEDLEAHALDQ